jgi:hypothetical protein
MSAYDICGIELSGTSTRPGGGTRGVCTAH